MRKLALLAAGVALSVGTLTACIGGPPPPPPTDPHDVLVVGDSVAFSFGCVLGEGVPHLPCPARPDYTTKNASVGACTIYGGPGPVLLYNTNTASVPNCNTVPSAPENRTWAQLADFYVPKVVVINTSGWEIVDRWLSFTQVPDSQWGGSTSGAAYTNAAVYYSSALYHAIREFRARGATVLVANAPHTNPLQPLPPPAGAPAGLECSWWEPYPDNAPTAQPQPGSPLTCPGAWRPPANGIGYRSSRVKMNQLNAIANQVLTNPDPNFGFGNDPGVRSFNFKSHFNQPGTDAYTSYVCPPPHDSTIAAQELPDVRVGSPTFGQQVWQCALPGQLPTDYVNAILARAPDNGHLSDGGNGILQQYIEPCVKALIPGASGGDLSKCS